MTIPEGYRYFYAHDGKGQETKEPVIVDGEGSCAGRHPSDSRRRGWHVYGEGENGGRPYAIRCPASLTEAEKARLLGPEGA